MLGNIDDSFKVKDGLSRLVIAPIFHFLKEKGLIFTTPSNMFILQNNIVNVNEISSQIFLDFMKSASSN